MKKQQHKYTMTISRLTVDKLGVKLYDRVSAVIAELVANSYDADATEVVIAAPMGELLAYKDRGIVKDRGFTIEVRDNGEGMSADGAYNEVNEFYLKVGGERRKDQRRGDRSKIYKRRVMGRKGVGKLAPFGVCELVEVISAAGKQIAGRDAKGSEAIGYPTAHFIMERKDIMSDTDIAYHPKVGELDGLVSPSKGTTIILRDFDHRHVPSMEDFERQMAQRFGLASANWSIKLRNSLKLPKDKDYEETVGAFQAAQKPGTQISFTRAKEKADRKGGDRESDYKVVGPENVDIGELKPGFHLDGRFYPVTGWVAYAKDPYRDDLMAGVRIYCRGKIAAQTAVFNFRAGFTGEHDVRSYLIGSLNADWLDETDDLIRTDRQDILWSHDLGVAFQNWGQGLVRVMGRITREPMRLSAWELFKENSSIINRVDTEYPGDDHRVIREQTVAMAELMAKVARVDELQDDRMIESIVQLSLLLGPHVTLDRQLREAAAEKERPLDVVTAVLQTARIAELASFGKIADDRVRVIERLETLKDQPGTLEGAFQKLLTEAPWLIDPTWSPITSNRSFETLRKEFIKFYEHRTGTTLNLGDFSNPKKQPDFVLSTQDDIIQIIEIKKPHHDLANAEMDRIANYQVIMTDFLNEPGSKDFKAKFRDFHITVVCDGLKLTGTQRVAFEGMRGEKKLTHLNWKSFLLRTHQMHDDFLKEAERQKKLVAQRL